MNSSTSNSRDVLKIVVGMVIVLIVAEISVRQFVMPRSETAGVIKAAKENGASLNASDVNVVILGNSFTILGVEEDQLREVVDKSSSATQFNIAFHAMYGSHGPEWFWLARHWYLSQNVAPDVIVLNIGPTSLRDGTDVRHQRLALAFGPTNLPLVPAVVRRMNSKEIEFVISRYSMLINRGRSVGKQIGMRVIPHFTQVYQSLSQRANNKTTTSASLRSHSDTTFLEARVFFDLCRERNTKIIVVAMPHRSRYELDPKLLSLIDDFAGMDSMIDHRDPNILSPADFQDGVHLDATGKAKYSQLYAQDVADRIRTMITQK